MAPHFSIHYMIFTAHEAECQQREGLRTLSYEECMTQMLKRVFLDASLLERSGGAVVKVKMGMTGVTIWLLGVQYT